MNKGLRWTLFLVIGIVIGFMGSLLFNNGEQSATKEPPPQTAEEKAAPADTTEKSSATAQTSDAESGTAAAPAAGKADNILVQKGCIQCHAVSPLGEKGNGTAPDLAIAYDDVTKRFGKSLEEFLNAPEGTMSAVLGSSPLTDDEKEKVISLIKGYGEK
ncbi:hypothetical protein ACNQFZ_04530 [Schinkia sp. CFF1]